MVVIWRNHRRLAKKRALAIQYSRGKAQKAKLYRELIAATRATVSTLERAVQRLAAGATIEAELWLGQVRHYLPLIERIIPGRAPRPRRRGGAERREAG